MQEMVQMSKSPVSRHQLILIFAADYLFAVLQHPQKTHHLLNRTNQIFMFYQSGNLQFDFFN